MITFEIPEYDPESLLKIRAKIVRELGNKQAFAMQVNDKDQSAPGSLRG